MLNTNVKATDKKFGVGIVSCGALAREILHLQKQLGGEHWHLKFLPAALHNRPKDIPAAVMKP